MSATTIHQALYGYRRGHELLAGSIRLPSSASDLVTRLSDLSGSTTSGWEFTSYITGYPVIGSPFYAIARTWEDKMAARAGCVLTHTLLVPIELWKTASNPMDFAELFVGEKELRNEEQFKKPLHIQPNSSTSHQLISVPAGATVDFVQKYYGEGLHPLIWIDCPNPEDTVWAIIRVLWPALREKFAWCTASLQPRSIDTKPLDLQFVPAAAYSRFHKIQRENFVGNDKLGPPAEPWCQPCAQWIFSGSLSGPVDAEMQAFGPYLRDDPTLMRHLFLAKDLADRVSGSPAAGAGLLDVAEVLAPNPEEAVAYKSKMARKAVDAAATVSPDEALKCLFLVGERLTSKPFLEITDDLGDELTAKVDKLSSSHPRESLIMPERVVTRANVTSTPYFRGVVRGLTRCAKEDPSALTCLQEFNKTAPHLIAASPSIAGGFLRALHSAKESKGGQEALAGWIGGLSTLAARHSLRKEVLPEIRNDHDVVVLYQLCRDIPSDEVEDTLSALAEGTGSFESAKLLATLQELIASPYPEEVRAWSFLQKTWSRGITSLVSATFPLNATGLSQVIAFGPDTDERRSDLLTVFLDTCTTSAIIPGWLKDEAAHSVDWLIPLLLLGSGMPPATSKVLDRIVPELRRISLATRTTLRPSMIGLSRFAFWPALVDLTLRGAVTGFVEGDLSEIDCRGWFSEEWASDWAGNVSRNDLAGVLIHSVHDLKQRERAFRWLAFAPPSLYERHAALVPGLFWELVSERRHGWTQEMGNAWADAIRRVRRSTPGSSTLRMCADVLQFGFDHAGDTVGAAVAAAFYPVYCAVCDSNRTPPEVSSLFGMFDWDKAKELRKGLVRAFVGSNWSPGDLALAASEDEQLLRKLIKRTLRTDNGHAYLTTMLNDLVSRKDPSIARTVDLVRGLASNPDFHEPWD